MTDSRSVLYIVSYVAPIRVANINVWVAKLYNGLMIYTLLLQTVT